MSITSTPSWPPRLPAWFWVIVLYQARGLVLAYFGVMQHDYAYLLLLGQSIPHSVIVIALGLTAWLMTACYLLQDACPNGVRIAAVLMVLGFLGDIALVGYDGMDGRSEVQGLSGPVLRLFLDVACVAVMLGNRRLQRVFWSRRPGMH